MLTGAFQQTLLAFPHRIKDAVLDDNLLTGTVPPHIDNWKELSSIGIGHNAIVGTLPESVWLRPLWMLLAAGNKLTGSISPVMVRSDNVRTLLIGGNHLEGSIPWMMAGLSKLYCFDVSCNRVSGNFPLSLARFWKQGGDHVCSWVAHRNLLQGSVPLFGTFRMWTATFHQNMLEALPSVWQGDFDFLMLHGNRLSCRIPGGTGNSSICLVGIGNHIQRPRAFPQWVSPDERHGLFWLPRDEGFWQLLKATSGVLCLLLSTHCMIGFPKLSGQVAKLHASRGQLCVLAKAIKSLINHLSQNVALMTVFGRLFMDSRFYVCPSRLLVFSACLSSFSSVHCLLVVLWSRTFAHSSLPWWTKASALSSQRQRLAQQALLWLAWPVVICALSSFVTIQMFAQCVPSFLGIDGIWLKMLSMSMGFLQSIVSSVIVPCLGRLLSSCHMKCPDGMLDLVTTFLLPCLVVLGLDGVCMSHWADWWQPCRDPNRLEHTIIAGAPVPHMKARVGPDDICKRDRPVLASPCARSIMRNLQPTLLGKLTSEAFVLPAVRVCAGYFHHSTKQVGLHVAMFLKLALLLGAVLPLASLLLLQCVVVTYMHLAHANDAFSIKVTFHQGVAATSIVMAMIASMVLQFCFVSVDIPACVLMASLLVMAVPIQRLAMHSRMFGVGIWSWITSSGVQSSPTTAGRRASLASIGLDGPA